MTSVHVPCASVPCAGTPTPYEHAIYGIGRVLEFYDSDKMFPVYGFGGQMPDRTTSHCFAINGNNAQPFCAGVHGIAATYRCDSSTYKCGPST